MTGLIDAAVIGGGPAGLSAASWLARYRRRVALVDGGSYRNGSVARSHGYLALDPVDPGELRARAREALLRYPTVELHEAVVDAVGVERGTFTVSGDGLQLLGRRLVLATGVRDVLPAVGGVKTHYGADLFHCPSCDGYEARDRRTVVLGWGPKVAGFALELRQWARSVTVVTDQQSADRAPEESDRLATAGVEVVLGDPLRFVGGRGRLEALELADGRRIEATIGFFTVAHEPDSRLAGDLGCRRDDQGYVVVDGEGQTSVAGVYAAGDCTPGVQLVQVAAGQGTVAGVACATSLRKETAHE